MAYVKEIDGNELDKFMEFIPNSIIIDSFENDNYIYYGLVEDNVAIGVIIFNLDNENVQFSYAYVLPAYRARGIMTRAMHQLMIVYWNRGYENLYFNYNPRLAPAMDAFAIQNDFVRIEMDSAYFEFTIEKATESTMWSKKILHITKLADIDEHDKRIIYAQIEDMGVNIANARDVDKEYMLDHSIVYMGETAPEGLVVVERDEFGMLEIELVFLKTKDVMAPYYMASAIYEDLKVSFPPETIVTFYSKNGYMTSVLEKILGVKPIREIVARYDLTNIEKYSNLNSL
jgi:GNAT superfamily N-acetyltransferase